MSTPHTARIDRVELPICLWSPAAGDPLFAVSPVIALSSTIDIPTQGMGTTINDLDALIEEREENCRRMLSRNALRDEDLEELADRFKPPQQWYTEEDC